MTITLFDLVMARGRGMMRVVEFDERWSAISTNSSQEGELEALHPQVGLAWQVQHSPVHGSWKAEEGRERVR